MRGSNSLRIWADSYAAAWMRRKEIADAIPLEVVETYRGPQKMRRFDEVRDRNWYEANGAVRDLLEALVDPEPFLVVLPNGQGNLISTSLTGETIEVEGVGVVDLRPPAVAAETAVVP